MPLSSDNQVTIEKTPHYMIEVEVPERVYKFNPKIKLIAIVRDPTIRALSHFTHDLAKTDIKKFDSTKYDNVSKLFEEGVIDSTGNVDKSLRNVWLQHGIYVNHIKRWLQYFPKDQFLLLDGDSLIENPYIEVKKTEKFLNLRPYIQKEHFLFDESKGFYCMNKNLDGKTIECLKENKGRKHPFVSQSVFDKLNEFYKPYNMELFKLVNQTAFLSV